MVFPPCPSMKRLFQGSPRRPWESSSGVPDDLSPLPVEEKAIPGAPPEGPDNLWREYSRWPFSPACRGNGDFSTSPEVSESPQRECLFTLPVEGKAIPERPNSGLRVSFHPACRGKAIFMRQKFLSVPEGCKTRSLSMKKASPTPPKAPGQPFSSTGEGKGNCEVPKLGGAIT